MSLTSEQLRSLSKGDLVELGPLLKGLTPEPLTLYVNEVREHEVQFTGTLYGVTLGIWIATLNGEDITWSQH